MKYLNLKLVALVAFLTIGLTVNAQMITDRPSQTESSSTVGTGNLQIESGVVTEFGGDVSSRKILAPTTLFRYGFGSKFEVRLVSQYEINEVAGVKTRGMSDMEIGAKYQLFAGNKTNVAILSHLVLPTGTARPNSNNSFSSINKIAVSHEINDKVGIGYNVGVDFMENDVKNLTYSFVVGVGVNDKVGFYVEPYGEVVNFEENFLNFDAGITYALKNNLQFDFSFGTGVNHRMNFISLGCSWLIKK